MLLILLRFLPNQIVLTGLRRGNMNTAPGLQSFWLLASGFTEESCLCFHFVLCDSLYYWQCDLFILLANCLEKNARKKREQILSAFAVLFKPQSKLQIHIAMCHVFSLCNV